MRIHTNAFKENVKLFGRELDSIITYEENNEEVALGNEDLNSISLRYEGAILKSVMKQLDIDSNVEIPIGTEFNFQFGVKVREEEVEDYRDNYDYINYGNFVVDKIEIQEDTSSYKITCYDKILYSMKDYEDMSITYPITVRDYIGEICNYLDLTFANSSDTFANYNQTIPEELYLSNTGNSLGYTFRDVLDDLAEVTASTICINEDDELEIRYINDTEDTIDEEYLKDVNVNFGEVFGPVNTVILSRAGGSDKISISNPSDLPDEDKIAINIEDNLIMNSNDRDLFLADLLDALYGLTYSINDYSSTGICYYDVCDKYSISIGENTYTCIMLNDEINITQGLEENIYAEKPKQSEEQYKHMTSSDKMINQAYLIVKKNEGEIEGVVSSVQALDERENNNYQDVLARFDNYLSDADFTELQRVVRQLQTDTYTKTEIQQIASGVGADGVKVEAVITETGTFDADGLLIEKTNAKTKGRFNEIGMKITDATGSSDEELLFAGYDETLNESIVRSKNINVTKYLSIGTKSRIEDYEDGTGVFYVG